MVVLKPNTSSFVFLLMMALQLFLLSKFGFSLSTDTVSSLSYFEKIFFSKIVRDLPMCTEVIFLHRAKANAPMLTTPLGIFMDLKASHPWNELCPILVTESGIVIEPNLLQSTKAWFPIFVTDVGIIIEVSSLHLIKVKSSIFLIP